MNFSGSEKVFCFWGRFKGSYNSADLFSSIWIAGFGKGFQVIISILCIYFKVLIFKDYS